MNKKNVLVVATSRKTRGGISAVVNAYAGTAFWENWHCCWLETHSDKSRLQSLWCFIRSFFQFLWFLPGCNIVHLHLSDPVSAMRKTFFFIPAWIFRKNIIIHFHAASAQVTIDGPLSLLYRFLFSNANRVIVLSEFWKDLIEKKIGKSVVITVVYNPCNLLAPNPALLSIEKQRYVLFAGTLNARKGYSDLIRAFGNVSLNFPDWKLLIAGNGEIQAGKDLVKKLQLEKNVEFTGWISGKEKDEIFYRASVFCLPSYAEGFPMSVLDAMNYSIPVITTQIEGLTEEFSNNTDLLLFKAGDIEELSDKLQVLIKDIELRKKISSNASRILTEKFSLKIITDKMDAIYKSLV